MLIKEGKLVSRITDGDVNKAGQSGVTTLDKSEMATLINYLKI